MRVIDREIIQAIRDKKSFHKANTEIRIHQSYVNRKVEFLTVRFYNTELASCRYENGQPTELTIYQCFHGSDTTKRRINVILDAYGVKAYVFQKKWNWYFNIADLILPYQHYEFSLA